MDLLGMAGLIGSIGNLIGSGANTYMTAKMQRRGQEFEHNEAILNRDWQTARQREVMNYNSAEVAKERGFNHKESAVARSFSAREAAKTRRWEKAMSDTAVRRRMADLEKAGINPLLAGMEGGASTPGGATASGGSGASAGAAHASTPGGAQGHAVMASLPNLGHVGSSAVDVLDKVASIRNKVKEGNLIDAQAANMGAQSNYYHHSAANLDQQGAKMRQEIEESKSRIANLLELTENERHKRGVYISEKELKDAQSLLTRAQTTTERGRPSLIDAEKVLKQVEAKVAGEEYGMKDTAEGLIRRGGGAVHKGLDTIDSILESTASGFFRLLEDYERKFRMRK